jgi:hypothetical protein
MLWRMPADLGRQRIGMMFITVDASRACTTRSASRRLVHDREMRGGNAGNTGNLESLGNSALFDGGAKRRKPAETGGNSF